MKWAALVVVAIVVGVGVGYVLSQAARQTRSQTAGLTECVLQEEVFENTTSVTNTVLYLYGNGTTQATLARTAANALPLAPDGTLRKEFVDTGRPYIHTWYIGLDAGSYRLVYHGASARGERVINVRPDRELRIHIECP